MIRLALALALAATACTAELDDDIADDAADVLTPEELADDEAAAEELPIARETSGEFAWTAASTHASRINPHRKQHDRGAIRRSACLDGIARRWARRMASGGCAGSDLICHRPDSGPSSLASQVSRCWAWGRIGENVGVGGSEPSLWSAFLASAPHHANIDRSWNSGGAGKFGVGIYRRGDGTLFVAQVFATRR